METTTEYLIQPDPTPDANPAEGFSYDNAREAATALTESRPTAPDEIVEVKADFLQTKFEKSLDEADEGRGVDIRDAARALTELRARRAEQAEEFQREAEVEARTADQVALREGMAALELEQLRELIAAPDAPGDLRAAASEDLRDTPDNTNWVEVGDSVRFSSDGGADDSTMSATCSFVVRPF